MKLRQRYKTMQKAREMYIEGSNKSEISEKLKVSRHTLIEWCFVNKWDNERQIITDEAAQKAHMQIVNEKARTLLLINAYESQFAEKLQNREIDVSKPSDLAQLEKVKWEILNPKTISQHNFIKNELNVDTKVIKFVIEDGIKETNNSSQEV